jgi:tetratricopeptide (TPR) repeat protein
MQAAGEVRTDGEKAAFYFDLAKQMQARFHHSSAIELFRLTRRYEGNSPRLLYRSGMSCLDLSSPSVEAVWLLRKAAGLESGNYDAWYLLGKAYQQQGNSEESIAAFRKAASLGERAEYWIALGKSGTPEDEAQAAFGKALALDPSNALAHFELGRLLSQKGRFEQARAHLSRAVELEPDFYEAYYALGRLYARTGEREQSQKYLALFERTKRAALEQAVAGSGYIAGSREP